MFYNECMVPERAMIDFALKIRLDKLHPKRSDIEEDFHNRMAGHWGEKSLDFYLSKLNDSEYHIIHNLRLPSPQGTFFQIDNLILKISHLIALEVKNWSGRVHFDQKLDQVYRTPPNSNEIKRVQNPVIQAKEQAEQLTIWLKRLGLGHIPIEYFYINANSKTIITADPGHEHLLQRVCNSEILVDKILQTNNFHKNGLIDNSTLQKLGHDLLASHTPPQYDIQKLYGITADNILTGVHCPICFSLPMEYKSGTWICRRCGCKSKTAHIETVYVYFLLIKPFITNVEFRNFLHLPSPNVAFEILKSMKLPSTGSTKGRIYHKPEKMHVWMNKNMNFIEK